jgi:hypothetical protein
VALGLAGSENLLSIAARPAYQSLDMQESLAGRPYPPFSPGEAE